MWPLVCEKPRQRDRIRAAEERKSAGLHGWELSAEGREAPPPARAEGPVLKGLEAALLKGRSPAVL